MEENFGADGCSEGLLWECVLFGERLDLGERVLNLVPLIVNDLVQLLQGINLLAYFGAVELG